MIALKQVTSLYPRTDNGLKNFSSSFMPGVYALLGRNGSGKTTLFRHLIGALLPQIGNCEILGKIPGQRNPDLLKEIFLVPEDPFFPEVSSIDYVRGLSSFYPQFDHSVFQELLQRWEVPQNTGLRQMSQGQKKKFLIAFALATQAKIILFDEPTNGLDIVSKMNFKNLGTEMFHPEQLFIFATHQIKDVENLITHITLIDNGKCWGSYSMKTLKEKFITLNSPKEDKSALFSFPSHKRYLLLKEKKGKTSKDRNNNFDLEIFFTAFLQNPMKFKSLIVHE